ncbi:MAG: hypothetical protein R3297_04105, partial [Desulfobulbales bacterium]|nr:hypothetical protein [Desulfobulbales bacterium]
MKKISRNIFFFILIALLFVSLAPRLFFLDEVQKEITARISTSLDSYVTTEKMHWVWLPLPHLTLISTRLSDDHYNFFLPRVKIYPSWKVMLGRTDKAGKIVLENPSFHINKRAFLPRESPVRTLPEFTFAILNGKLEVEGTESYKDILRKDSVTISDIDGTFILQPQELAIDLRGSAPVSKSINLRGSLN